MLEEGRNTTWKDWVSFECQQAEAGTKGIEQETHLSPINFASANAVEQQQQKKRAVRKCNQ